MTVLGDMQSIGLHQQHLNYLSSKSNDNVLFTRYLAAGVVHKISHRLSIQMVLILQFQMNTRDYFLEER
jgi:hypothetical protein